MKLSIIIPCYNEQDNIPHIIDQCQQALKKRGKTSCEILLVNNGSTDNSAKIFNDAMKDLPADTVFKIVNVPINKGYGYGILAGLNQATGQVLAWTHADLQTDPLDVFTAFDTHQKTPNNALLVVKGKRKKRAFVESFFTFGMQVLTAVFLRTWLDDINAQPKVFSRDFFNQYIKTNAPDDFSLDLFLLYWAKKHGAIKSVPVHFKPRLHGEAKGGGSFKTRIKLIKRTLAYIMAFEK